jgi:DNA adenine methylase
MAGPRPLQRPFLKWAGGKSQLLHEILPRLPERIATYYEPFVGGGAVFFALARERRFERAVLADTNPELVEVYRTIQQDVDGLISELLRLKARHSQEHYYQVRASRPRSRTARAARVIYLNKTGFNGLYRLNSSGQFNVPFGRYKNPKICDEPVLRAAAQALEQATIEVADFEQICRRARPGDTVYLDPPYVPLSDTAYFTAYAKDPFGMVEHRRLAAAFADLAQREVFALLSNSDTPETRQLYRAFRCEFVPVARSINSKSDARGPVSELLATAVPVSGSPRGRSRARGGAAPARGSAGKSAARTNGRSTARAGAGDEF